MEYEGKWISEIGVKKYRNAVKAQSTANISLLSNPRDLQEKFKECDFGCHHPGYRVVHKTQEWYEVLRTLDAIDPLVAGVANGVRDVTYRKANNLGHGIERSAEGLHLMGGENFRTVGDENVTAYNSVISLIEKILDFDLSVMENPIMQVVTYVINEYSSAIPEFIVMKLVQDGSIIFSDGISKAELLKAVQYRLIGEVSAADIEQFYPYIEKYGKRAVGKQIGKKISVVIAAAIATKIAKGMLAQSHQSRHIKKELVKIRKGLQGAKGGYAKALLTLLETQGTLGIAARDSRRLRSESFILWKTLRFSLTGADMIYFLMRPMVQEYVDRISLLEKNPAEFVRVMQALAKTGDANKIFLL